MSGEEYCYRQKTWWGKHISHPVTDARTTTNVCPPNPFSCFLRENGSLELQVTLGKGGRELPRSRAHFQLSTENTVPHPPPNLSGLASSCSPTSFCYLWSPNIFRSIVFCCVSPDQAKCESLHHQDATITVSPSEQMGNAHGPCRHWTGGGLLRDVVIATFRWSGLKLMGKRGIWPSTCKGW